MRAEIYLICAEALGMAYQSPKGVIDDILSKTHFITNAYWDITWVRRSKLSMTDKQYYNGSKYLNIVISKS